MTACPQRSCDRIWWNLAGRA